jgi:flagellar assembly protein FliH
MGNGRKLISGAQLSAYEQWELPMVGEAGARPTAVDGEMTRPLTAAQLEALHAQAFQEGFEQGKSAGQEAGYRDGRSVGEAEARALVERLEAILGTLAAPLEELDREVEESLVGLVVGMVRHLVRRELKTDPGQVIAVVREAVAVLPVASRTLRLYLHPGDAALVRERMRLGESEESAWQIVDDPAMTRGGCRVVTDVSVVDATVEQRLATVVAKVLGEDRRGERAS